jgi:hypothetical protein
MPTSSDKAAARACTIDQLFAALRELIERYPATSPRRGDEAERITGEIARHLSHARARLATSPPRVTSHPLAKY